jgi:general secretion pathway protein E
VKVAETPVPLMDVSRLSAEHAVIKLIEYAASLGASDLFFATDDEQVRVQVRRLGLVQAISIVSAELGRRMLSHIRACSGMDLSEKRRPLDGRWIYRQDDGAVIDLRISMIPTIHGEDLALRLLIRESRLLTIDNVGLTGQQMDHLTGMLESPSGLVLLTGPTGSGKSATLYACLQRLNNGQRKINTIEDPIEYDIPGLRQSQINQAIGLGFPELLRSVLRQSPDVIMIGEIRDPETADTAVRAANSGHLVLATIHASAAAGAVQSMRALGVHPHFLATALRGVASQRLVRTLCPHCRISFDLSHVPTAFEDVRLWLKGDDGRSLWAPRGCEICTGSGYTGRIGVFEVMAISETIRKLIAEGRPTCEIRAQATAERMLGFRQAALIKVAKGLTCTEEILRIIPPEQMLADEQRTAA